MQLVIIAGGKGTRLGLKEIPKPMIKIGDKPLLHHQIELAKKYNIKEIFILSGHKHEVIEDYFKDGKALDVKIHHIVEPYPLGTAGSLKLLEGKLEERFMVFYGDIVMDFDINSFIAFDKQNNSIGTLIAHPNDHPFDSDLIQIDKTNKVLNFLPKPHNEKYYQNLVNAAVYIFSNKILNYIEKDKFQDFGKDILPKIVQNKENLFAYKTAEYIKDMGTKERFEATKNDFLSKKVEKLNKKNSRPCIFIDRDGVINENMDIEPSLENFKLLENVEEAIKLINKSEYLAIIITNQPMIAKGFTTFEEVDKIHQKLETLLGNKGAFLNEIYYCPHHPESGFKGEVPELKIKCNCRKPEIGLFLKAKEEFNIDFSKSWTVGDSKIDIEAGKKAGTKTISINGEFNADFKTKSLLEAVQIILKS